MWFDGVEAFLQENVEDGATTLKDPRRVFNADESGFPFEVTTGRVLAPRGAGCIPALFW